MFSSIHSSWIDFFDSQKTQAYFQKLISIIEDKYSSTSVFPKKEQLFRVFETNINDIKVVILGQDPYPTYGYANGLCFSVNPEIYPYPKSLLHIFREIKGEYPSFEPENGDLNRWKDQGVFLLNTILSVEKGVPLSHKNLGWEIFTTNTIKYIHANTSHLVYLLWGKNAHAIEKQLNNEKNLIIKTSHPSPLGYTKSGNDFIAFKNSGQFKLCNTYLSQNKKLQILW
jgi:uracil-DNA glycosylase